MKEKNEGFSEMPASLRSRAHLETSNRLCGVVSVWPVYIAFLASILSFEVAL